MWFFTVIVVLLIGAVAVVASGRWGGMSEAYDDRPDMRVPSDRPLAADDIESSRFGVGVRGYRMDEVDSLLERVAREVADRDRRIADLERAVRPILQSPERSAFVPLPVEGMPAGEVAAAPAGRHNAKRPPASRPEPEPAEHNEDDEDVGPAERRA
jgi:DivIVA domain-containing protein